MYAGPMCLRTIVAQQALERGETVESACDLAERFAAECCRRWGHDGPMPQHVGGDAWICARCGAGMPAPDFGLECAPARRPFPRGVM